MRVTLVDPSNFTLPYDYALAEALRRSGCDVSILKRRNRANEEDAPTGVLPVEHFYVRSEAYRSQLQRIQFFTPVKIAEHVLDLSRLDQRLRMLKTDVVHFQWLVVPWLDKRLLSSVFRRVPTVLTVHDTRLYHGSATRLFQSRGWIEAIRCFDNVIVHTKSSYDVLIKAGVSEKSLAVVPHGALSIGVTAAEAGFRDFDQNSECQVFTLLLFGYLKAYKGLDTIADALQCLSMDSLRRIRLVIAGKPHEEVVPVLKRLKSLMPTGSINLDLRFLPKGDLAEHIRKADIVLFPYHRIDASGAFMATLPFGKIIIASRVGVFPEYLENRKNGMLFGAGNSGELAAQIESVINDACLRKALKDGALELATKTPTWPDIATQTISIYERARTNL